MNENKDIFEQSEEGKQIISALESARNAIVPDASLLKRALLEVQARPASAGGFPFGWRIIAPVGVFAVLLLAFAFGHQKLPKSAEESAFIPQSGSVPVTTEDPSVAALDAPVPKPSGNVDSATAALFAEMSQESAALGSQADAQVLTAQNESNQLNSFNYGETGI